jgi:hypothetical protein
MPIDNLNEEGYCIMCGVYDPLHLPHSHITESPAVWPRPTADLQALKEAPRATEKVEDAESKLI